MAFQVPNTLLVTVHGATDLAPRDHNGTADPFVKVAVPGYDRIHQTQVRLIECMYIYPKYQVHMYMGIHSRKAQPRPQ